jgi:beta-lactamase superfamily II metal-dependent hydrolase
MEEHQIQHIPFLQGNVLQIGSNVSLASLWPRIDTKWESIEDLNDVAQVCRLQYRDFSVLFAADAEVKVQDNLIGLGSM